MRGALELREQYRGQAEKQCIMSHVEHVYLDDKSLKWQQKLFEIFERISCG